MPCADIAPHEKKRKSRWQVSYSKMTQSAAEERLGLDFQELESQAVEVSDMLKGAACGVGCVKETKEKVYMRIVEYLQVEGYPTEASPDFKEANVNDLVLYIIGPILFDFKNTTGRNLRLQREKELIAVDSKTGGHQEFVVVDKISVLEQSFVLVVECKRSSLGEATRQCLLAMNDMWSSNGKGKVYGFVTTGEDWRMVEYDGVRFEMTQKFTVLFSTICKQKDRWMREGSVVVDCIFVALCGGGVVKEIVG